MTANGATRYVRPPGMLSKQRARSPGEFNQERADHAIDFIQALPHIRGKEWAGKNIQLDRFQREPLEDIFGTLNPDGTRQYRTIYWEIAKKNGKTTVVAPVGLYLLFADKEPGAEVYCLDPSTLVLRANLTWTAIGELAVGEALVSIDETGQESRWRKLREAFVTDTRTMRASTVRVHFDDGSSVVCTPNHRWLVRPPRGGSLKWRPAGSLRVGFRLRALGAPWAEDTSREAGYLAGLFDGEGYLHAPRAPKAAFRVGVAQNPGPVLAGAVALLEEKGFHVKPPRPQGVSSAYTLEITGLYDTLRFLGQVRPSRLLSRNGEVWNGKATNRSGGYRTIVEIEQLPKQDVIDISTSIGTYIAAGLYSHNSAAHDRDQASISFDIAKEMVKKTPGLSKLATIQDYKKKIVVEATSSFWRAVEREAAGQHGYNVHGLLFDEFHTQRTSELYNTLKEGTAQRQEPMTFLITTAGFDRASICYELHDYAMKVLKGIIVDPTFYPVIFSLMLRGRRSTLHELPDNEIDWQDESQWSKANPALGSFLPFEQIRTSAKHAKEIPSQQNEFKRLRLNIWTQAVTRLVTREAWNACAGDLPEAELIGLPSHGGLDLATTQDIAAFVLLVMRDEERHLISRFWCPEETILRRTHSDGVPYMLWAEQGYIKATPGNVIDFDYIEAEILKLAEKYDIWNIRYDRWQAAQIVQHLEAAGLECLPVGMGFGGMSEPTKDFTRSVLSRQLQHTANPVMDWMIDNLVAETDAAANMKPSKKRSTERIDGPVAAILATDGVIRTPALPEWRAI